MFLSTFSCDIKRRHLSNLTAVPGQFHQVHIKGKYCELKWFGFILCINTNFILANTSSLEHFHIKYGIYLPEVHDSMLHINSIKAN